MGSPTGCTAGAGVFTALAHASGAAAAQVGTGAGAAGAATGGEAWHMEEETPKEWGPLWGVGESPIAGDMG